MSDDKTVQDLIRMREQWVQTRDEADAAITALDRTIKMFRRSDCDAIDATPQRSRSYSAQICDAIELILERQRPLHRKQVLDRLLEMGFVIGGAEPMTTLASYLSRDARFKNAGRGCWTLALSPHMEVDDEVSEPRRLYAPEMDFDGASAVQ